MTQTNPDLFSFGPLLKAFRKSKRLTQQQLAEAIGVHRSAIVRWEQGDFLPESKTMILELARHLHLHDQETRQLLEASLTALAPHWLVPLPRNPFFTGREEILEILHTQLGINQAVILNQSSALNGLGGVGKTQIVLEYAYRYALEYSAVFWIGAETEEQIVSSLLRIAETLQLPGRDDKDQHRVVETIKRWLSTHSQWLLIWDNLEDLDLLDHFLPSARSGAILITTRCQALGTLARGIDLLPMAHEEGMLFLLRRAKILAPEAIHEQVQQLAEQMPSQYTAATELVTAMGGLPLALDQAGAYIEESGCSLSDYLQHYKQQQIWLLDRRGRPGATHPQSVKATFMLSMERAEQEHHAALDVLHICALLHAEAIPEELFVEGAVHLGPELESLTADTSQFDLTISVLRSLSLVQRHPETHTLSLHRLVQAVLRERMSEQEQGLWLGRVIQAFNAVFPEVIHETWKQCERLLPHVLAVAMSLPDHVEDQALAQVLRKTADYLYARAQYEEAEPLYKRSLHILQQSLESEHVDLAFLLNGLANLYREQGKYEEAEPLYKRSLHILQQSLGLEHVDLASPLNGLALLYFRQGKHEEAEPLYKQSLHILQQSLGLEHVDLASPLNGLALLYFRQGKYEETEPLYKQSLHILQQSLGSEHPDLASSLRGLADLYNVQGKYEEAEPLYKRALSIMEQALGPEHPNLATVLSGLANLYSNQGEDKHKEAEPLYKRALSILEQTQGPGHPHVAYILNNLADLYYLQGKNELAGSLYTRAVSILEQASGPEHPHVANMLNGLANVYLYQGKDKQAEMFYERALSIMELHYKQDHPDKAGLLAGLARLYEKQGKEEQAEMLLQQVCTIFEQHLGHDHPQTVTARNNYQHLREQRRRVVRPVIDEPQVDRESLQTDSSQNNLLQDGISIISVTGTDFLSEFLVACCESYPRAWCRSADLWQAYELWTERRQESFPLSRGAFIAQLKARGYRADRTKTARIWRGITLVKKDDDAR